MKRSDSVSGLLLIGAACAALAWANSPLGGSYAALWHAPIGVGFGRTAFERDLHFTVTIDLSSQLPSGFTQVDNGILQFTDACGRSDAIGHDSQLVQIIVNVLDGGTKSYSVSCYANV